MGRGAGRGRSGLSGVDAPDEIDAGRVLLRRWGLIDAETTWRVVSGALAHVGPWMAWARPGYSEADCAAFRREREVRWGTEFDYAIVVAEGDVVAGSCSLMTRIGRVYEIGYWLHPDHVGHGYVTAAAGALVSQAFDLGARAVEIVHDEANVRSGAVPLRLGFTAVERRAAVEASAPGERGQDIVWRVRAP